MSASISIIVFFYSLDMGKVPKKTWVVLPKMLGAIAHHSVIVPVIGHWPPLPELNKTG
ncbi:MAG: hypothetical protein F6J93_06900 [Oscillatoria sp. SIO1A7]|nr:hypothetical protein [Oscillatoria sp. SIO1A7]